jgi:hypothetical protein
MNNLLIFFDNNTFKFNSVIYNYIKKLILYDIVYKKYIKNEYNDIILFKTNPFLIEIKLNKHDDYNDINGILLSLNNIIYKKYEYYENNWFKSIINKIKDFELNNSTNKKREIPEYQNSLSI